MYRNINKQQKTNNYLKQKLLIAQKIMNSNDRYIEEQISKIKNLEKRELVLKEKLEDAKTWEIYLAAIILFESIVIVAQMAIK